MPEYTDGIIGTTLIDSKAAAKKLSCSLRHLDAMRLEGKIPHVRLGQLVRFSPAALDRWVQEQTVGGNAK
jgi:excisionase family DNA binding protein